MFTDDEKDYIMRMIKEIARVLASVMLGKKYVQVELPVESKYQISGDKLHPVSYTHLGDSFRICKRYCCV